MRDKILKILPSKLKDWRSSVIKSFLDLGIINHNVILAGGAFRSCILKNEKEVVDFDIFLRNIEYAFVLKGILLGLGAKLVFECPQGKLYSFLLTINRVSYKIQIISEVSYSSVENLLAAFDVDAGCAAYDGTYFYFDTRMIMACKTKQIGLINLSHPMSTFKRVIKYREKGFGINKFIEQYVTELIEMGMAGVVLTPNLSRFYID